MNCPAAFVQVPILNGYLPFFERVVLENLNSPRASLRLETKLLVTTLTSKSEHKCEWNIFTSTIDYVLGSKAKKPTKWKFLYFEDDFVVIRSSARTGLGVFRRE
mmetsp:Transcript_797/g.2577  ORF Transcript_797/g.2577 Transcript_797/m.2577 type:complete len:104 (-) Transcript_797:1823-2134(-)